MMLDYPENNFIYSEFSLDLGSITKTAIMEIFQWFCVIRMKLKCLANSLTTSLSLLFRLKRFMKFTTLAGCKITASLTLFTYLSFLPFTGMYAHFEK